MWTPPPPPQSPSQGRAGRWGQSARVHTLSHHAGARRAPTHASGRCQARMTSAGRSSVESATGTYISAGCQLCDCTSVHLLCPSLFNSRADHSTTYTEQPPFTGRHLPSLRVERAATGENALHSPTYSASVSPTHRTPTTALRHETPVLARKSPAADISPSGVLCSGPFPSMAPRWML